MKHHAIKTLVLTLVIAICGCSTGRKAVVFEIPDKPNPSNGTESAPDIPDAVDIEVKEYEAGNEEDGEEKENGKSPETAVTENNIAYTVTPKKEDFSGGAVIYNYVPNHIYKIFLAPYIVADIQLEPGERIVSPPACGDTANFMLGTSFSYAEGKKCEHIYIKAVYAGKSTTLSVNTDKRVYQFSLRSYAKTYMPIVTFNYPLETLSAMKAEAEKRNRSSVYLSGSITDFTFSYEILPMSIHKPHWMPSMVFDDGKKTYIHFVSARRASYAPVLFIIEDGKRILCNYRVLGDYYIVDRTFDRAELILDVNAGNIITIKKGK